MQDFYTELQSNQGLMNRIAELSSQLRALHAEWGSAAPYMDATAKILYEIYRVSNYHTGLLFPYLFPTAIRNKPLSLMQRPFAFALTGMNAFGETTIRGSRQISKSTTVGADALATSELIGGHSTIYIAPRLENLRTFQNRLRGLERHARYMEPANSQYRKNLGYKEYRNGSTIDMQYVNETVDNVRSKSCDRLIFDEAQHFDANMLPEIRETQTASELPSSIYAGTSTTLDTFLEAKYQDSSQGTFMVRDGTGRGWIDCGDGDKMLEIIKPRGPTCPKTNRVLDMTDVRLVHRYRDRYEARNIGIHVPKIIVPDLVRDEIEWSKIYNTFKEYSSLGQLKKFLQEVLGIPTEEGVSELTQADLEHMCCLTDSPEKLLQNARQGYYRFMIAGVDWGGSDYNPAEKTKLSFTFHAILGVTVEGNIDIVYMARHAGMDYERVIQRIAEMNALYGVRYVATDHSAGSLYNLAFRKNPLVKPAGHFVIQYGGNNIRIFSKAQTGDLSNHYVAHKTETLTELILAIKQDRPRIRCYNFGQAFEHLRDFLCMRRVIEETDSGASKFRYRRHGSKPDDGVHAVNFAFIMARAIRGEPLIDDPTLQREIYDATRLVANARAAMGDYVPGSMTVSG